MPQRWITHEPGLVKRGDGAPPEGSDLHFVDEEGALALVGGRLYLNGQPADEGEYPLHLEGGEEFIVVDKHGKAKREKREGQGNGNGSRNPRT